MPSAVIRNYEYLHASAELRVTFQSGRRYRYMCVPNATYAGLKAARAKGEFFNEHIRGRYPYVRENP